MCSVVFSPNFGTFGIPNSTWPNFGL